MARWTDAFSQSITIQHCRSQLGGSCLCGVLAWVPGCLGYRGPGVLLPMRPSVRCSEWGQTLKIFHGAFCIVCEFDLRYSFESIQGGVWPENGTAICVCAGPEKTKRL